MKLKKNLFLNTVLSVSNVLFPLLTFPYTARVLQPVGIGVVSYVDSFVQFFLLVAALGIPTYGIREVARTRNDAGQLSRLVSELLLIHLLMTLLSLVVFGGIILANPRMHAYPDVCFIGMGVLSFGILQVEWFFAGLERFDFIVARTLLVKILSLALLFVVVSDQDDYARFYFITLFVSVVGGLVNLRALMKQVKLTSKALNFRRHLKPLLLILGASLAVSTYIIVDSMILGTISNERAVGLYSTAVKINKVPVAIVSAMSAVVIPRLSVAFRDGDWSTARHLLGKSFEYILFLAVPISVGLFVAASEIIQVLVGSNFAAGIITVQIMAPLVVLLGLSNLFGMQMLAPMGKERWLLIAVSFGMVVSVAGNFMLIPVWQHNGAATINLLVEGLVTLLLGMFAIRFVQVRFPLAALIKALAASLPFWGVSWLCNTLELANPGIRLAILILGCSAVYVFIQLWIFRNQLIWSILDQVMLKIKRKSADERI